MRVKPPLLLLSCCLALTLSCSHRFKLRQSGSRLYTFTADSPVDSSILEVCRPYRLAIDSQINTVLASAARNIVRKRPDGPLNNLVADTMAAAGRRSHISFDFVHCNYKSLRVPLPKGPIKVFRIFELMPFENYVVAVKVSGPDTRILFDYMAASGGDPIAGASYRIESGKAVDIRIGGKPLDPSRSYTVLTNDYLANGGDLAEMYRRSLERNDSLIKVREAILSYLREQTSLGKVIDPLIDGRITTDKPAADE